MKRYTVEIELDSFYIHVSAKNKPEARKKALEKLKNKDATKLISTSYPDNKKIIWIDEE